MSLTIITLNSPQLTDFAKERNTALAQAKTDWVLFVDSDEVVTPALKKEIDFAIQSSRFTAYYLPRRDTFLGKTLRHGETGHAKFIRLARRNFGHWVRPIHETWVGEGRVGELKHPLLHSPHLDLSSFVAKIDHYSTLDADYRFRQGRKSSLFRIWLYPIAKFKLNYFFRLGFLDGIPGLIHALMMSWHSYLTWSKLYLLCKKP